MRIELECQKSTTKQLIGRCHVIRPACEEPLGRGGGKWAGFIF